MKLFVVGTSGAGKTPIAQKVAARLAVRHVAASSWVRAAFPSQPDASDDERRAQIAAMTAFSVERLRADPRACVDHLAQVDGVDFGAPCVIEGMRNPFDFVHAFDPRHDRVVFLVRKDNALAPNAFERGVDVIRAYLAWGADAGIFAPDCVLEIAIDSTDAIEAAVERVLAFAHGVAHEGDVMHEGANAQVKHVHADIAPLDVFVQKEILYGNDARFVGDLEPCKAFAFSSYPGSAPTFKIVLADGAVFSYVAPSVLRWKRVVDEPVLPLPDLVYLNCPAASFVVCEFDALRGDVLCFFKHPNAWLKGTYRFTVDWYEGNDLLHCVFVENGQIAFLPHHKIKFHDDAPGFRPYKKLRNDWRV